MDPRTTALLLPLCLLACTAPEPRPTDPSPAYTPPRRPAADPVRTTTTPAVPSLASRLRSERIGKVSFTSENGDYRDVARFIYTTTNIPVLVSPSGRQVIDDEALTLELELVAPITVENLLNFMTSKSDDLVWVLRDGVVFLTSRSDAGSANLMQVYDVRDLTFAITSFIPPEISEIPTDSLEARDRPRTGGEAEDKVSRVEPDVLVSIIRDATDPDYWSGDTGASIEALETGYLVVNASREMHLQIARFLGQYR